MSGFLVDTSAGPYFLAAEIEVYRPGGEAPSAAYVIGEAPIGAIPPDAAPAADSTIWRASDSGYVTPATPPVIYPPTLAEGFAVNRQVDLSPNGSGASVAWGALRILNYAGLYDATGRNSDQRAVRVLIGRKQPDTLRGRWTDPAASTLAELFAGLAQPWTTDDDGISIPVRDASVWAERPYQAETYAGTGTTEGNSALAGRRKPRARGGTSGAPIRGIEPVQIDPVANIWQWTDAAGSIVTMYENGKAVFTVGANVADLWTGTTAAGAYRTDSARGLFQLGSPRAGRITLDGHASFPVAGAVTTAAAIARYILAEDMALPAGTIDTASFTALNAAYPYTAGWFWPGTGGDTGASAAGLLLASIGARLIPTRGGQLRGLALRAPGAGTVATAAYTTARIVEARRASLPDTMAPPPARVRLSWGRQHTVLSDSELNATLTDAQRQAKATQDQTISAASAPIALAWRRPSDPPPIVTALLDATQAASLLVDLAAFYAAERNLYGVELPLAIGVRHDLGDVLQITYPLDGLTGGKVGTVVGEALRLSDTTTTLFVVV